MEGGIGPDVPLDYVEFHCSPSNNRYEALLHGEGKTEKVSSGLLEHLQLHLPGAKVIQSCGLNDTLILQLPENLRGSLWFTKSTVKRFLHIIGDPESLKVARGIEDEISQLEETRRFHLSLYARGQQNHSLTGATDSSSLGHMIPQPEVLMGSSDTTKNELLRVMDLRLTVLNEELVSCFNQATGTTCSLKQVADLAAFTQHFEAIDLRNFLSQYLSLSEKNEAVNPPIAQMTTKKSADADRLVAENVTEASLSVSTVKPNRIIAFPAKIAEAERQLSESDETSNSSDEDTPTDERSRPLIRSASPRRSASPMRRVQIGRSGSRRAPALTIKSLGCFPAREKLPFNKDAAANISEDEESGQQPKKAENAVRRMSVQDAINLFESKQRMSVQDAINLFESKQRDQKMDNQIWRSSTETSGGTNKSVLRRWSAGMSETSSRCPQESSSVLGSPGQTDNGLATDLVHKPEEAKQDSNLSTGIPKPVKIANTDESSSVEEKASLTVDNSRDLVVVKAEEGQDRATASAEWNRQKEAELNQMLMKMLESKPAGYRNTTNGSPGKQEISGERRGGFYDHYKEKRDVKICGENAGKQAEKEAQFKVLQETLKQRKAEMPSKSKGTIVTGKQDSVGLAQRKRKSSSPSTLPKKEPSKAAASRKASSKTSPLPAMRSSWPSTLSPRSITQPLPKLSSGTSSFGTTPNRRRPQPTPSPTRPSSKLEKHEHQQKGIKGAQTERKKTLKNQGEKKPQTLGKSSKSTIAKTVPTLVDDSITVPAKPSFYNKVTKKSTVVPLESKPFLRKGTGISSSVSTVAVKSKNSQSDEFTKSSVKFVDTQENDAINGTTETKNQPPDDVVVQSEIDDADLLVLRDDSRKCENSENPELLANKPDDGSIRTTEIQQEIHAHEHSGISLVAWVEIDHEESHPSHEGGPSHIAVSENVAPVAISSPRVRHSLSQMLQADSGEPDIVEWCNAENPPAMIYQKESPKGLKRLLKFARKSKGEANVTGWASPSVFSEGEEDAEESKAAGKRNLDSLARKVTLQAKGFGQQKTMFSESYNGGNSSKGSVSYTATTHELLSAQANGSSSSTQVSHKLREGRTPVGAISTKATRSFFSLSTFRSSKSSEAKLR